MHARRNYHIAAALLVLATAAAGYCFYKLGSVGLGNPIKAQMWFGLLLGSLAVAIVCYLVSSYNRSRLTQSSGDEIAIQALVAAGRSAAKAQAQAQAGQAAGKTKTKPHRK